MDSEFLRSYNKEVRPILDLMDKIRQKVGVDA